ncbi:MAG: hypothetical protein K0R61_2336 [Microvirga sp.]|nr:hypothetical protein [Microvirga sp.]
MMFWAAIVALVSGAFAYAEIVGVVALFTLICAAEAFSIPKASSFDKNSVQAES